MELIILVNTGITVMLGSGGHGSGIVDGILEKILAQTQKYLASALIPLHCYRINSLLFRIDKVPLVILTYHLFIS